MQPNAASGDIPRTERGWLGLLLALAVYAGLVAHTNFLIDDAYISFRYAENWANFGVPGFQPDAGGSWANPVEGYSNFLWVVLLRACAGVDLEVAARVLSIACGAALLVLLQRFVVRDLRAGARSATMSALLLAGFPPFVTWCTGGLEGALFALLLFAVFRALMREGATGRTGSAMGLGLLGVGLALVRTEGIAWVLALALVVGILRRRTPGALRRIAIFAGVASAGFALFLLWRHGQYGDWISNTAHAKANFSGEVLRRGAKTVASYFLLFLTPFAAFLALPYLLRRETTRARGERLKAVALGAAALLTGFAVYNVLIGGDWMPMFRFLAPASPFLALLLGLALGSMRPGVALPAFGLAFAVQLLPALGYSALPRSVMERVYFREFRTGYQTEWERLEVARRNGAGFRLIGRALAQVATPADSLTLGPIGAIGFFSGLRLHDRNGLVDREVAMRDAESDSVAQAESALRTAGHDRRVARAWFLERQPTMFDALVWPSPITAPTWPGLEPAARSMMSAIQADPAERPLLECTIAEAYPLEPAEGVPPGATLLVLRSAPRDAARVFWSRVLQRR